MTRAWLALLLPLGLLTGCSEKGAVAEPDAAVAVSSDPEPQAPPPAAAPPAPQRSAAPSPAAAMNPADFATVREYTELFYAGNLDVLHEKFSAEMREVLTMTQFVRLHAHMRENYGEETVVIAEDTQTKGDFRGFVRWARFDKTDEIIEVQWILKPDDVIAGFFLRPAARKVSGEAAAAIEP
jgi:hypothetical protein